MDGGIAGASRMACCAVALGVLALFAGGVATADPLRSGWSGLLAGSDTAPGLLLRVQGAGCNQPQDGAQRVSAMLDGVNAARASRGLSRLRSNPQLQRAAQAIACDNARREQLTHTDARGQRVVDRVRGIGYRYRRISENLSMRRNGADSVVQSWIGSPAHNTNMFDPQVREFGGAVAQAASGQIYWAVVHGLEH